MVEKINDLCILLKEKEWFSDYVDFSLINENANKGLQNLIDDNKNMEVYCTPKHFNHVMSKKDFFESKNTKELCRHGVPYFYIKDFVLKMFSAQNELEDSFKLKHAKVFKERDRTKLGDYVPYLTGFDTLQESLSVHYLNEQGIQSVKEVQWMLNNVIPTMEYTPLLLKINSLLHMFCSQAEVYFILRNLINLNYSLKETYKIRWHMRFNYDDNKKVIGSMIDCIEEISGESGKNIIKHLDNIGITAYTVVENIVFNFFMGYLSYEGVVRLLMFYLREGTKALYRMIYALFKTLGNVILTIKNKEDALSTIRKEAMKITDFKKLFDTAYDFNLTRNNNKYDFQPIPETDEFSNRRSSFYLPSYTKLEKAERILNEENLIKLWSKFPFDLKIKDCRMIYSTTVQGFALSNVYQTGEKLTSKNLNSPKDYHSLFMLETMEGEIFGGLMSRLIGNTGGKTENPSCINLISIKPSFKIYEVVDSSLDLICGDDKSFLFGMGEEGSAIRLDDSLSHGFSNPCKSFDSPKLTTNKDGEYKIKNFEIYILN